MAEYDDREHFIPMRKSDLLDLLLRDPTMTGMTEDREGLRRIHTLTGAVFHFEYFEQLEHLKNMYAPFDPDNEMLKPKPLTGVEREKSLDDLFSGVKQLLEKANFQRLSEEDIKKALDGASEWGINMDVDMGVFDRYEIYVRGDTKDKRYKKHWWKWWITIEKEVEVYKRFVLICKMKKHKRLSKQVDTEGVYLKICKDIPKLDIEMMIPGGKIIMPIFQKATMGGSLFGGLGYLLYSVGKTVIAAATLALTTVLAPVAALLGFGFKQYTAYNTARQKYSLMLSESLYYQTLDNNAGVLTRLLDEAEEQECREVLLGYFFLWKYTPEGATEEALDNMIEEYITEKTGLKVDFEIGDSLEKLVRLNMARKIEATEGSVLSDGLGLETGARYVAEPLEKALEALDYRWDNYFTYNQG